MALSSVLGDIFQTDENHVLFTEHESFAMTPNVLFSRWIGEMLCD